MPTAQNLHSASRGGGASRSKAEGELTLGLMSGENQKPYAEPLWGGEKQLLYTDPMCASLLAKLLILPLLCFGSRSAAPFPEAERRRCAGGTAARMPR
ncbi:hypothetical protein EMIT0P253_300019 [Pseudomonas sp. IT-P253]